MPRCRRRARAWSSPDGDISATRRGVHDGCNVQPVEQERDWSLEVVLAELRSDSRHIQQDIAQLRSDVRRLDDRMFQLMITQGATLAAVLGTILAKIVA